MNVNIKFYDDVKTILIPLKYENFLFNLSKMLEIQNNMLNIIEIYYKDEEGDKIIIQNDSDYNQFLKQLKNGEVNTIEIELNDDNMKDNAIKSFIRYNNIQNEEKDKNNILNEIINNNNEKLLKDNKNNNNIIINDNDNNCNEFNNPFKFLEQQKKEIPENLIYQPKKINNNIPNNNSNNINKIQKNISINNNNIINNNNNNKNNLNNNNLNNNNNIKINEILKEDYFGKNDNNKNIINFPVNCSQCTKYPIQNILYKCDECTLFFCEKCEEIQGPIHIHPLLKIRTMQQFQKWNSIENNNSSSIIQAFGNMKDSVLGRIKSISGYFTGENHNNINNNIENKNNMSQKIQYLKNIYDLKSIPDYKIEEAIKKSNGNLEETINYLFS